MIPRYGMHLARYPELILLRRNRRDIDSQQQHFDTSALQRSGMRRDMAFLYDHDDLLIVVNLIGLICDAPHSLGVKHITQAMPHTVVVEPSTTRQPAADLYLKGPHATPQAPSRSRHRKQCGTILAHCACRPEESARYADRFLRLSKRGACKRQ